MNALDSIKQQKMVVIVRGVAVEDITEVAKAIREAGVINIEITFDQASKETISATCTAIEKLKSAMKDDMFVGAGTVLTVEQAVAAKNSGADFILAPNVNEDVIKITKQLGMYSIPGALTPSEIVAAHEFGADIVKLFPAGSLGVGYVKSIVAPINHIPLMGVGDINIDNIASFRAAGMMSFGIGSNIVNTERVSKKDMKGIEESAKKFMNMLK